uniref:Choline transporter-like protein n=1 Tax=Denticeps clupeoides TaxID=299321 RepID=A0AAY4AXL5_9TELE
FWVPSHSPTSVIATSHCYRKQGSCCAWLHGDPRKVIYPTDSSGQYCGQKGTANAKKAILFYFNILKCANPAVLINLQCPTTQMCVSKCPDRFATYADMQFHYQFNRSHWDYYKQFCRPGFNNPKKAVTHVLRDEDCPSMLVPSRPCKCILEITINPLTQATEYSSLSSHGIISLLDAKEVGIKIVEDYASSWYWILIGLVIALVVSLIFILLLRFTAGILLWFIIIGVIVVVAYGIWHCYQEFSILRYQSGADMTISDLGFQTDFRVYLQLSQTWLVFCEAIGYIMSALFYPIITFFLLAVCFSYWAVTAVFLASSGEPVYKVMSSNPDCLYANQTCNPETFNKTNITQQCTGSQCSFAFYGGESLYHRHIFILQLSNLLVFLWLVNFTIALGQCTLAGAFATYYWAQKKPADIPICPVFSSFARALRYHVGSLAFGSLILAVVQVVRIVLEYLDQKLKGAQNAAARFLLCCLKCCFWCLERFIRFINRNAYIMIAIYGTNFCTSAREAFYLVSRRADSRECVIGFFFFTHKIPIVQEEVPVLHFYWVPVLTVIFGSYLIAHGFFSVYAMCVDTLFLCFCEDLERHDGTPAKPFLMSPDLQKILGKSESPKKSRL